MKKIVTIILLLAIILSFSACNLSDNSDESVDEPPFVRINDNSADKVFMLSEIPFTSEQIEKIKTVLDTEKNTRLDIDETGKLSYDNNNIEIGINQADLTKELVLQIAEDYLRSMDLLPSGDYTARVLGLDTIHFLHTYDGVPLFTDDDNEGIVLWCTGKGISKLEYRWSNVTPVDKKGKKQITASKAKKLYLNYMEKKYRGNPEFGVPSNVPYQQIYYYKDGKPIPCYLFGNEEPYMNAVCVNAVTGKIMDW